MSILHRLFIILLVLMFMSGQSCKTQGPGEEETYNGPILDPDAMKSLTNNSHKAWKPLYYTRNGKAEKIKDCESDDYWIFYTNGDLKYNWGSKHCFQNEPATQIVNWGFQGTPTFIRIESSTYAVYELYAQSLVIKWTEVAGTDTFARTLNFIPAL